MNSGKFWLKMTGLTAAIIALAYVFSNLLIYLVISLILSTILKPVVQGFTLYGFLGLRIPKGLAIFLAFALFLSLVGLLAFIYAPLISSQAELLKSFDINFLIRQLTKPISDLEAFLLDTHLVSFKKGFLVKGLKNALTLGKVNAGDVGLFVNSLIEYTSSFFVGILAVTFITFYLLYDQGILKRSFLAFVPNKYFELVVSAMFKIERLLTNYLLGLFVQILSIFTLTAIGLGIIGYEYAISIALFAALINIVPYIGPLTGSVVSVVVGLATYTGVATPNEYTWFVIKIVSVAVIVHLIDNIVLQPQIFSKSVKAHPLEIFVAIFAGAAVGGIVGMVVAVPVLTVLRVSYNQTITGYGKYKVFRNLQTN